MSDIYETEGNLKPRIREGQWEGAREPRNDLDVKAKVGMSPNPNRAVASWAESVNPFRTRICSILQLLSQQHPRSLADMQCTSNCNPAVCDFFFCCSRPRIGRARAP